MSNLSDLISLNIEQYLKNHENKEICRFITCGSVDDGKSTLIGRLLYDSKMIFEDQLSSIMQDSKKYGTTGEKIDLALLVDGLQSEREQGITIDVAYRFFSTDKRKFIIADTPGHEQYTRNMATGASNADIAVILIDARQGVLTQTKRHSYIVSLLGIKNIIVAINKMDLIDFSQEKFEEIKKEYEKIILKLPHHHDIHFDYIPVSALNGDNIISNSKNMPWYKDKSLMDLLDTTEILTKKNENHNFRFMVQYVNRPNLDFRGFCGTVSSGKIKVGESITVLPSKKTSKVKEIILPTIEKNIITKEASLNMAITLTLEDEIDINRGDLIVKSDSLPQMSNKFSVMIVWMSEKSMKLHNSYIIKRGTTVLNGIASEIMYTKNINTFEEYSAQELHLNDIAKCVFTLDRNIAFDSYNTNRNMGSFIIIDKYTNETIGAGMIISSIIKENEKNKRIYTKEDIELNAFIRKNYPEWDCKSIYE